MSEQNEEKPVSVLEAPDTTEVQVDEKSVLLQQARLMGLTVSNNIGIEKLREKLAEATASAEAATAQLVAQNEAAAKPTALTGEQSLAVLRRQAKLDALKLIRVRITCHDPKKEGLHGEIHTIHNDLIGTVRQFVPYGEETNEGWHLPAILVEHLRGREFQHISTKKNKSNGQLIVERKMVREFGIEVLEPLTKAELAELKAASHLA